MSLGIETWVPRDLGSLDGAGGRKGETTESQNSTEWEGLFIQGGKSQACENNPGGNT